MQTKSKDTVLVTGATGFVGSHCVKQLLERGYKVRGTVRNIKNDKRNGFLKTLVPSESHNLELVEADLLPGNKSPEESRAQWKSIVNGCKYILHVASPFPLEVPKDEQVLIKPAVQGTLSVLQGALDCNVKKVVITSSLASIWTGNYDKVVDETYWAKPEACSAYEKSKMFSEKEAWEFWEKNNKSFGLSVMHPAFIMGPILTENGGSSEQIIKELMMNKGPGIPKTGMGVVDVRDVARAHILTMENEISSRYVCAKECYWFMEMADILRDEYGKYGYKITSKQLGKWLLYFASFFSKTAAHVLTMYDQPMKLNCSKIEKDLNFKFSSAKEAILAHAQSQIDLGVIPDLTKGKK